MAPKSSRSNPPGSGDYARGWGPPFHEGTAPYFLALNRGKRSVTVDLGVAEERQRLVDRIVREADAVISNMRPGLASARGLGPEQLLPLKPSLVYCDIGAFGKGGPHSNKPGYDALMQAYSGLMSITGEDENRPPIRVGVSIIDMGAGLWSAIGIISSLLRRVTTGTGGLVETSLLETALAWVNIPLTSVLISPRVLTPQGSGSGGIVPYQAFKAKDGWIVIAAGNDGLFAKLASAFKRDDLGQDERFKTNAGRVQHRDALIPELAAETLKRTVADIRQVLDASDVPNSPVQRVDQLVDDAQVAALGMIQQGPPGSPRTIAAPLQFDGIRPSYDKAPPKLGEHNDEVFAQETHNVTR